MHNATNMQTQIFLYFHYRCNENAIKKPYKFPYLVTGNKQAKQDIETKKSNALIIKQKGDKRPK